MILKVLVTALMMISSTLANAGEVLSEKTGHNLQSGGDCLYTVTKVETPQERIVISVVSNAGSIELIFLSENFLPKHYQPFNKEFFLNTIGIARSNRELYLYGSVNNPQRIVSIIADDGNLLDPVSLKGEVEDRKINCIF